MQTFPELWASIRAQCSSPNPPDGMSMLLRVSAVGIRLFAAVDNRDGSYSMLVELPENLKPKDLTLISSRTFEARVSSLPGLPQGKIAIGIKLLMSDFDDLFGLLGEDIASAICGADTTRNAVKAVAACIERWRRFAERRQRELSDEEVRGLLGELAVLCRCIGFHGSETALVSWQGEGGLRDFELPSFAVEVKTCQAAAGASVRISDPGQLESTPSRPVFLAVLRLSQVESGGWTLQEAVTVVRDRLQDNSRLTELFFERLADQGYLIQHGVFYPKRYAIEAADVFGVVAGFPRISVAEVPPGVGTVHFSVQLSVMYPFRVSAEEVIGPRGTLEGAI